MEERITLCGDNCIECPRYNAHTEAELRKVAELWYRVGWRETVVSNEEIVCAGCSSHKSCTYGCQTAHCGRGKPHFDFGNNISPIVRYRHLPQTLIGMTVDCCSLV